jgi:stage IV sporulation protein FB
MILPAERVVSPRLTQMIFYILEISIFWGIFNLLPIYPLDGGQISRELFSLVNPRDGIRQSLVLSLALAVLLALVALVQWKDTLAALFFGFMAYESYASLRFFGGRDPW